MATGRGYSRLARIFAILLSVALLTVAAACAPAEGATFSPIAKSYASGASHEVYIYGAQHAGAGRPWVMLVHGGAWTHGSASDLSMESQVFANAGYVVFNVNYRLGIAIPRQVVDIRTARAWVEAHAAALGADPKRGLIWGSSAGGNLVTLTTALFPDASVRGVITLDGVLEPHTLASQATNYMRSVYGTEAWLMGCQWTTSAAGTCASHWTYFDTQHHVSAVTPPFYVVQGGSDPVVPPASAVDFYRTLRHHGVTASVLSMVAGGGHGEPNAMDGGARQAALLAWASARVQK